MTNGAAGLVLTIIERGSPERTLVREQYPSIHGQRYFATGSTRVFVSNQSAVPAFSFSARMESRRANLKDVQPVSGPMAATAAAFSNCRRFKRTLRLVFTLQRSKL